MFHKKSFFLLMLVSSSLFSDELSNSFQNAKVDGEFRSVYSSRSATNSSIFSEAKGGNLGVSIKRQYKTNKRYF